MNTRDSTRPYHRSGALLFAAVAVVSCGACALAHVGHSRVETNAVRVILEREVQAGRLTPEGRTCLGFDRDRDPPDRLLRELRAAGITVRPASACLKPPDGTLVTLGPAERNGRDSITVHVEISNLSIEPGTHFALMLHRGVHTLTKSQAGEWRAVSDSDAELKE